MSHSALSACASAGPAASAWNSCHQRQPPVVMDRAPQPVPAPHSDGQSAPASASPPWQWTGRPSQRQPPMTMHRVPQPAPPPRGNGQGAPTSASPCGDGQGAPASVLGLGQLREPRVPGTEPLLPWAQAGESWRGAVWLSHIRHRDEHGEAEEAAGWDQNSTQSHSRAHGLQHPREGGGRADGDLPGTRVSPRGPRAMLALLSVL